MKSILIYTTHGTYGRDDDALGALLIGNGGLVKDFDITILLVDAGVAIAKKGQKPEGIGMPSNLKETQDFLDLGGRLLVLEESLEAMGIKEEELVEGAETVTHEDIARLIEEHTFTMTF